MIRNWKAIEALLAWAYNSLRVAQYRAESYNRDRVVWSESLQRSMRRERRNAVGRMWWCLILATLHARAGGAR